MKNKPFSSPLWGHVDLIRVMRREHKTWQEIADVLGREHNLKTSYKTIQAFFKRVTARGKLPLGWIETNKGRRILLPVITKQEQAPKPAEDNTEWDLGYDPNRDLEKRKE